MKKKVTISTTLNRRPVDLTVELELTEQDLLPLWEAKKEEYIRALNSPSSSFVRPQQRTVPVEEPSSYTPYSTIQNPESNSTEPAVDQQFDDCSSTYTPYASVARSAAPVKEFPKSYVPRIKNDYAPYSTFRVNMPQGWEPDSN